MFFFNSIMVGLREIWANKFRSLLTMLGIILGVSSLVAMSALVKGMENGMTEALVAVGGLDKVLIEEQELPRDQQHLADQRVGRTIHDVYALRASAPLVKLVSPEMGLRNAVFSKGGKNINPSEFVGAWPAVLPMNLHTVEHGRFFNEVDDENARSVVVIGTGIRDALFGTPEQTGKPIIPIGEVINVNGQPFTIIGMFEHYEGEQEKKARELEKANALKQKSGPKRMRGWGGGSRRWGPFGRKNYTAYIPLNTMWVKFRSAMGTNSAPDPTLTDIDIKVHSLDRLNPALDQAKNVLMMTHKGIEDFAFATQESSVDEINTSITNARRSGGVISAISLLVGGIGIMNIMLASITERIREIGVRKAIGASTQAVFVQILVESIVISLIGGALGLLVSYGFVNWLAGSSSNDPIITAESMIIAFGFSGLVGILAGLFPAVKAARLDPIQALKYD